MHRNKFNYVFDFPAVILQRINALEKDENQHNYYTMQRWMCVTGLQLS